MKHIHPTPISNSRIGFHFFPDTYHFRESDLTTWLPELKALGANWLVLETSANRAVPEDFIRPLISAGIEPILNLNLPLSSPPSAEDLSVLFNAYSNWGVHYISLFDRPNSLKSWTEEIWVQQKLVERFLNVFIPLAEAISDTGMVPIFPALEPGGNFWDTAFLRSALKGIQARKNTSLIEKMVIGAYAWPSNLPLNWGAGGPEAWPGARPYDTPNGEQDHCGFRIFDWYSSISQSVLGTKLPIILLGTGVRIGDQREPNSTPVDAMAHSEINLLIARLLAGEKFANETPDSPLPIPQHVLAGCFSDLLVSPSSYNPQKSWYLSDGKVLPIVQKMKQWQTTKRNDQNRAKADEPLPVTKSKSPKRKKPIKHYLLLPKYEWGIAAWYLEVSQPYIKKHSPTIGFSMREAFLAEKVTVVGGIHAFPDQLIPELEKYGSKVIRISGNGTDIATQLNNK